MFSLLPVFFGKTNHESGSAWGYRNYRIHRTGATCFLKRLCEAITFFSQLKDSRWYSHVYRNGFENSLDTAHDQLNVLLQSLEPEYSSTILQMFPGNHFEIPERVERARQLIASKIAEIYLSLERYRQCLSPCGYLDDEQLAQLTSATEDVKALWYKAL